MLSTIFIDEKYYPVDLSKPLSIGLLIDPFHKNPSCFYAPQPEAKPMDFDGFICSVEQGAPVNFYSINLVPHGQGTHTECVGHIRAEFDKMSDVAIPPFIVADLVTAPLVSVGEDRLVQADILDDVEPSGARALIIRTKPNAADKKTLNYTETNPPYLSRALMERIVAHGYDHLLLDLPSVDREKDDGLVANHKLFWQVDGDVQTQKTITEMIYVPDAIEDGRYLLQLQVSHMALDAVPSHPVLYRIEEVRE